MKIAKKVQNKWQRIREKRRKIILSKARGALDSRVRCRAQIIIALVQGKTGREIVSILRCSLSHVYNTVGRFLQHGEAGLVDRREDNGQAKITEQVQQTVWALVADTPRNFGHRRPTWTQELLILVLAKKTGIRLSRSSMSRLLARLKIRLGWPKPFVKCPWPKDRKALRLQRLRYLLLHARAGEVWVFADEVDIHLNPKIGRDWMLPGTQKKVETPGVNQKRYIAGALNAFTGQLTWVEGESKNSLLFQDLLFQLGWDYLGASRIHVILDNYSIHKSEFTKSVVSSCDGKVRLHFLPPYCPDYNKIERVWKDLHDNVTRNHTCQTMQELLREVRNWLRKRNKQLQERYAKLDPNELYAQSFQES